MITIPMSVEDVSALAKFYPDREEWRRNVFWDGQALQVTDAMAPKIRAVDMVEARRQALVRYANWKQGAIAIGGRTIDVDGKPVLFSTKAEDISAMLTKAARLQMPGAATSVNWQMAPGDFLRVPAADFITIATGLADFVQRTFDALSDIIAGIADDKITTREQIDAALSVLTGE